MTRNLNTSDSENSRSKSVKTEDSLI